MAGFRKAKPQQAAIKMGVYGPPGSGKTFSTLLWAEGLAKHTGKRIAFVDTERGTDFYSQDVPTRQHHPDGFDFDALYSRSITEVSEAITGLDDKVYGIVILDSITHIWEACRNAYSGKKTKADTIPFHAWGSIKKPYKALIAWLLSTPMHVFIIGRQGNEYAEDEDTGELRMVGLKMKAEGETPFEPHILLRMEAKREKGHTVPTITAFAEKDRTGVLAGKTIHWPTFENTIQPIMGLLGDTQGLVEDEDTVAAKDAEHLSEAESKRERQSAKLRDEYKARFTLAETPADLKKISAEITPAVKKKMTTSDVEDVRTAFLVRDEQLKAVPV